MAPTPSDRSPDAVPRRPADPTTQLRHDMRTSLTVIRGRVQLAVRRLRRGEPLDGDLQRTLADLLKADGAVDELSAHIDRIGPIPDPPSLDAPVER